MTGKQESGVMKLKRIDTRKLEEGIFKALMILSTCVVVSALLVILGVILFRGFNSLSIEMVTARPRSGYREGGILNAIVGSLLVGGGATALALAMSLPLVFYMNVYVRRESLTPRVMRFVMDLMWGVPSIVYGAFGFIIMSTFGMRASLGAAIIAVSLLELPIMVRAMDEVMRMAPIEIEEASYSMGATGFETAFKVILRQTLPGLATAVLMAFGRGIGDTAAVLFTAGFSDSVPTSLSSPAATLPLAVFFQLGTPFMDVQERAYAAAAILTFIVLAVSIVSRLVARATSRHVVR